MMLVFVLVLASLLVLALVSVLASDRAVCSFRSLLTGAAARMTQWSHKHLVSLSPSSWQS